MKIITGKKRKEAAQPSTSVCECITHCTFLQDKMPNTPALAAMIQRKYCEKNWRSCARYILFKASGKEAVPPGLFPTMMETAEKLIKGGRLYEPTDKIQDKLRHDMKGIRP